MLHAARQKHNANMKRMKMPNMYAAEQPEIDVELINFNSNLLNGRREYKLSTEYATGTIMHIPYTLMYVCFGFTSVPGHCQILSGICFL